MGTDFHYPRSRIVVIGLCPGDRSVSPEFGRNPSPSASRIERLYPNWRNVAVGANAWWTWDAWMDDEPSHVDQILRETHCSVVVALGSRVVREFTGRQREPYTWFQSRIGGNVPVEVLAFPHPSGRNRHWNDPDNHRRATAALFEAFSKETP